jgi:hypothetical protein
MDYLAIRSVCCYERELTTNSDVPLKNTSSLALTPLEFKLFNRAFTLMKSKAHASPNGPASSAAELSQKDVDIVADVLARWPSLQRFPGKQ